PSRDSAYPALRPDFAESSCRYVCRLVGGTILPDTRQPTGMPAAFTEEEIPCRPKGRPAFCGSPQNRDFSRKKCFFHLCARGKRNCREQFRRRGLGDGVISPASPEHIAPLTAGTASRRPESAGLRA